MKLISAISDLLHKLPDAASDQPAHIERSRQWLSSLPSSWDSPPADADAMARTYAKVPRKVPEHVLRWLPKDKHATANALLRTLQEDEQRLEGMSEEELAEEAAYFHRVAQVIEKKYAVRFRRNHRRMPTIFWPEGTATKPLLRLALRAWTTALLECHATARRLEEWGIEVWAPGSHWRLLVFWIVHFAQQGNRDVVTGLPLDFTGCTWSDLAPPSLDKGFH